MHEADTMTEGRSTVAVKDLRGSCCAQDVPEAARSVAGVRSAARGYRQGALRVLVGSIIVATNAVLLRRRERELPRPAPTTA